MTKRNSTEDDDTGDLTPLEMQSPRKVMFLCCRTQRSTERACLMQLRNMKRREIEGWVPRVLIPAGFVEGGILFLPEWLVAKRRW
jgi:hypothetical protein